MSRRVMQENVVCWLLGGCAAVAVRAGGEVGGGLSFKYQHWCLHYEKDRLGGMGGALFSVLHGGSSQVGLLHNSPGAPGKDTPHSCV